MENEVKKIEFDFNKQVVEITEQKSAITEPLLKRLKLTAFVILGGITIGISLGVTNNLMKIYTIKQENKSHISEIQAKNEELMKMKQLEFVIQSNQKKAELIAKESKIKESEDEKLAIKKDERQFNIWNKNKSDIVANYEAQLAIYDKAYQSAVEAVKNGLIGLDDLQQIRAWYQDYKNNIHSQINFINNSTSSFDIFHSLAQENKDFLNKELTKYENGDLNRSSELENILMHNLATNPDDKDSQKMAKIRKDTTNQIIDNLTDVIDNKNQTTKTKKLKM